MTSVSELPGTGTVHAYCQVEQVGTQSPDGPGG